ncbi:MAG: diacylglycerol kinase family protein [Clostridia bacterium]|nr:diacylglycerol kinase family protein [Clostridia bacterium]
MKKQYILFNPLAGHGTAKKEAEILASSYESPVLCDITAIDDHAAFFEQLDSDDCLVVCGGDGTISRFAQAVHHHNVKNDIFYFAVGSGNDFARDIGQVSSAVPTTPINQYLTNLPTVTVKGKDYVFVNGIGYGLDGYCCEVGDKQRETSAKPVNYTTIAIKALLFHYKSTNAKVTIDGETRTYKRVWIAPTMNGRYYGGGMMPTPNQDRLNNDRALSLMVFHNASNIRTLCILPSIFKGKHVKHKNIVDIMVGHDITVEFDRPVTLQIDGETVLNVTSYHAVSAKKSAPVEETV